MIKLTTSREYIYLAAETETARTEWIRSINLAVQFLTDKGYAESKPVVEAGSKKTHEGVRGWPRSLSGCPTAPSTPAPRRDTGRHTSPQGNVRPSLYDLAQKNIGSIIANPKKKSTSAYTAGENLKNQLGLDQFCRKCLKTRENQKLCPRQRMPYIVACGESHTFVLTAKSTLSAGAGTNGLAGPKIKHYNALPRCES